MKLKYIYGPVLSWRLGSSLGIDLLSQEEKICNFDCIYCQIGKSLTYHTSRRLYVPTQDIIDELKKISDTRIDYITLSGRGEPTLAKNLGETIKAIKDIRKEPISVITNSSLMGCKDVREELKSADFVMAKLDAFSQESFELINKPVPNIKFRDILNNIKQFRDEYKGCSTSIKRFALQIMLIDMIPLINENKESISKLVNFVEQIKPDEVQLNTPLRQCKVKALDREDIFRIKDYFKGIKIISVYDQEYKTVKPINKEDTLRRRGDEEPRAKNQEPRTKSQDKN